jgi:MFS family permease
MNLPIDEKWQVLTKRDFFLLTVGRVSSGIGSSVFGISIMWWMLDNFGAGSAGVISALSVAGMIILRPLGGVFVDRIDRRRGLIAADGFGAVFVGILAGAALIGTLEFWHFILSIIGTSFSSAIISPATRSLIPEILNEDELTAGNSVLSSLTNVASLTGPALAGTMLALFSYELVFTLNAASYGIAMAVELFITTTSVESVTSDDNDGFLTELKEGIKYLFDRPRVKRIAIASTLINFFASPILLVAPALIEQNGYSAFYAGLTETLFAVGTIIAGFALVVIPERDTPAAWETEMFGAMSITGLVFAGAAVAIAFFPDVILYIVLVTVFLIGISGGIEGIKSDSIVQASVDDDKLGRIFGLMRTFGNIAMPLSMAVTGFVIEYFSGEILFTILSSGVVLTVFAVGSKPVYALLTGNVIDTDGSVIDASRAD